MPLPRISPKGRSVAGPRVIVCEKLTDSAEVTPDILLYDRGVSEGAHRDEFLRVPHYTVELRDGKRIHPLLAGNSAPTDARRPPCFRRFVRGRNWCAPWQTHRWRAHQPVLNRFWLSGLADAGSLPKPNPAPQIPKP